jgi:hypothetical protein
MYDKFANGTRRNAIIGKNVFNFMRMQYEITDEQKFIQNADKKSQV